MLRSAVSRFFLLIFALLVLFLSWAPLVSRDSVIAGPKTGAADPNAACAPCHREIYERYSQTPMANASGVAAEGFIPADFKHASSGIHYRVSAEAGHVWLAYQRDSASADRMLNGRQELRYFIGSGKRGRTYLFEQEGYWFEAPVNWYGKKRLWDMAPNHLAAQEMPLTMQVDPGCLHCHASSVAHSLPDARNRFASEPFATSGITCAACHGDGKAHVASGGIAHILKIGSLEPVRRDSVCLSCHLEGQAAVVREGKTLENFVPGDNLFDSALFFVYKNENGSGGRATSQWEALLRSECKQKSGDRMTCTTCHDPHSSPTADEKVAFYRQRCLQCHNQAGFAEQHHTENPDCTACHMARPPSNDISHEQVTDHWIKRRVSRERLPVATKGELEAVGGITAGYRDLGLAYAQMAARGDQAAGPKAVELLRRAEGSAKGSTGDHEVHAQLGFLEQVSGHASEAGVEYRLALQADPYDALAGEDLALIVAGQHDYATAERLLKLVLEHDPSQSEAGVNLALVECGLGKREAAIGTLDRVLEFAPDFTKARSMVREVRSKERACGTK